MVFVRRVALFCCTLHNVCERHQCPFEPSWLPGESMYVNTRPMYLQASVVIGPAAVI